jgi:hypothetical protein
MSLYYVILSKVYLDGNRELRSRRIFGLWLPFPRRSFDSVHRSFVAMNSAQDDNRKNIALH